MEDYTSILTEEVEAETLENDPGNVAIRDIEADEAQEREVDETARYQTAYDQSPAATEGPSTEQYDYRAAFADGANLKAVGEEGVRLPLKHFKPGFVGVGGFALDGTQVRTDWQDTDGHIKAAATALGGSRTSTATGAPPDDIPHLARAAYGMDAEGGDYDAFNSGVSGNWNDEQKGLAWEGGQRAQARIQWEQAALGNTFEDPGGLEFEPAEIYVDELPGNEDWMSAAQILYDATPRAEVEPAGQDMANWALNRMSLFSNNVQTQAMLAVWVSTQPPEVGQAFLRLMEIYDSVDNWDPIVLRNATTHMAADPTNYIMFGGGVALAKAGLWAGKRAFRQYLIGTLGGATAGAAFAAEESLSRQTVKISAGQQEGYDLEDLGIDTAAGTVVGGVLGGALTGAGKLLKRFMPGAPQPTTPTAPFRLTAGERGYFEEMLRTVEGIDDLYGLREAVPSLQLTERGLVVAPEDRKGLFDFIEESIVLSKGDKERLPPGFYSGNTMDRAEGTAQ